MRYYQKNKEKVKGNVLEWQKRNPEKVAAYKAKNARKVKEKSSLSEKTPKQKTFSVSRQMLAMNIKRCRVCKKILHRDMFSPAGANGVSRTPECRECRNKAIASDPSQVINRRIRSMFRNCVKKGGNRTFDILGYTPIEVISHFERQFVTGMGWHNASLWHIDHIIPISSFKFSGPDDPEINRAWALSNLRPIWACENLRKSNKRTFLI